MHSLCMRIRSKVTANNLKGKSFFKKVFLSNVFVTTFACKMINNSYKNSYGRRKF